VLLCGTEKVRLGFPDRTTPNRSAWPSRSERRERATRRLAADSSVTIAAVAHTCRFLDTTTFTRASRRRFGVTPSEWRAQELARRRAPLRTDGPAESGVHGGRERDPSRPRDDQPHEHREAEDGDVEDERVVVIGDVRPVGS